MLPANGRTSGCLSILSLAFTQTPRPPPQCHLGAYSVNIDEDLSMLRSQKPESRNPPPKTGALQRLRVGRTSEFLRPHRAARSRRSPRTNLDGYWGPRIRNPLRSEEHTSELQSPCNLVCRLL